MRLSLAVLLFVGLTSCGDDDQLACQEEGTIINRDLSRWACGGGWFFKRANDDTVSIYFANSFQEKLESWSEEALPTRARFTLEQLPADNACNEFTFDVSCLEFIEEP